jgi:hypothetical protein
MLNWSTYTRGAYVTRFMRPRDATRTLLMYPGASAADASDDVEVSIFAREMFIRGYNVILFDHGGSGFDGEESRLYDEYHELVTNGVVTELPLYTVGGVIAPMMAALFDAEATALVCSSDMFTSTQLNVDVQQFDSDIPLVWTVAERDSDIDQVDNENARNTFIQVGGKLYYHEIPKRKVTRGRFQRGLDVQQATELVQYMKDSGYILAGGYSNIDTFEAEDVRQNTSLTDEDVDKAQVQLRIINAFHQFSAENYEYIVSGFAPHGPSVVLPNNTLESLEDVYLVRSIDDTLEVAQDDLLSEEITNVEFHRHNGTLMLEFSSGRVLPISGFPSLSSIGIGEKGLDGLDGAAGADGADGTTGVTGPRGCQGLMGPTGPRGRHGAVGPRGPSGNLGPTGPRGMIGPKGFVGQKGANGVHVTIVQPDEPVAVFPKTIWCQTSTLGYLYREVLEGRGESLEDEE